MASTDKKQEHDSNCKTNSPSLGELNMEFGEFDEDIIGASFGLSGGYDKSEKEDRRQIRVHLILSVSLIFSNLGQLLTRMLSMMRHLTHL